MAQIAAAVVCAVVSVGVAATAVQAQEAAQPPSKPEPAKAKPDRAAKPASQSGPKAGPSRSAQPQSADGEPTVATAKDPAAALASYNAGVKSYQGGKFDAAIVAFNAAINAGGLPNAQLAKALYYRGASYQQSSKHGQAISDLNSALWFKGGLDEAERADATKLREAAYADAGLADQVPAANARQSLETGAISSSRDGARPSSSGSVLNAVPAAQAAEPSSGLGGIGSMFGNLFGTNSSGSGSPGQTQSVPAVRAAAALPTSSDATPEVLPWANRPPSGASAPAEVAPAPSVAPQPDAAAKPKKAGTFRIQVAAVKSRDEASAVITKLQGLGGEIAALPPVVDEANFGSMGKFFRVRLGPFADAAAAKVPCAALKAGGLDCLVMAK